MYRFLFSARWIGYGCATLALTAAMTLLGNWQWVRYQERSASNAAIAAGDTADSVSLTQVLPRPVVPRRAGAAPSDAAKWARVAVTGRYDSSREIMVRGRTVNGSVGFEVVTPLVLPDDTAVLINRGFIAAPPGDAMARPAVPSAPAGEVSVTGRVHLSESRPRPVQRRDGRLEARRIAVPQLAGELPYPVFNAYVLLTEQTPAAASALVAIPVRTDNAWQSGAYAWQWWLFAVLTVGWFVWSVRREGHGGARPTQLGVERSAQPAVAEPA